MNRLPTPSLFDYWCNVLRKAVECMAPRLIALVLAINLMVVPGIGISADRLRIEQMLLDNALTEAQIEFELSDAVGFNVFSLSAPDRVVIDFDRAVLASSVQGVEPGRLVQAVRHALQPDQSLRVVFDLARPAELEAQFTEQREQGVHRLVLTLNPVSNDARPEETRREASSPSQFAPQRAGVPATSQKSVIPKRAPDRQASEGARLQNLASASGASSSDAVGRSASPGSFVFGAAASDPDATGSDTGTGLVTGAGTGVVSSSAEASAWALRVDRALVESGVPFASARPADTNQHVQAIFSATRALNDQTSVRLGLRVDGHHQRGRGQRVSALDLDYDEAWIRYRGEDWRLTVGTQKVIWGRTDEISPTDRLSTKDFTRFGLDDLADRRRANPAVRLEWYRDDWALDMLWLPAFRPAAMPKRASLWHPVDQARGRVLGLPENPLFAELVRNGRFQDRVSGDGGGGIRLSRTGRGLDYALTVQRARHSEPYYRMNEAARLALLATGDPGTALAATQGRPLFESRHPRTWVLGGDVGIASGAWTWRFEAAWLSDVPVTRQDMSMTTVRGFDWVIGTETFPGDRDFRVTVQLAGMHLLGTSGVLDRRDQLFLNGELENPFMQNRLRGRLRFSAGLDHRDLYLNPELAWVALEPHEFYLGVHWMSGEEQSLGGFYRDRRLVVLGWRGQF